MQTSAWVSIAVTIALFVIGHLVVSVWWASQVNTLLNVVKANLVDLLTELKTMRSLYITKSEFEKDIDELKDEQERIWEKIDRIQENIISLKKYNEGKNG